MRMQAGISPQAGTRGPCNLTGQPQPLRGLPQHRALDEGGSVLSGPVAAAVRGRRAPWGRRGAMLACSAVLAACGGVDPHALPWTVAPVQRSAGSAGAVKAADYLLLARQYGQEGRRSLAAHMLDKAAQSATRDADADTLTEVAVDMARLGALPQSIGWFQQVLALRPDDPRALNNLAHALVLTGRTGEAESLLRRALAVDPGHARAQANLAALQAGTPPGLARSEATAIEPVAPTPPARPSPVAVADAPHASSPQPPAVAVTPVPHAPATAQVMSPQVVTYSLEVVAGQALHRLVMTPVREVAALVASVLPGARVEAPSAAPSADAGGTGPMRLVVANGMGLDGAATEVARTLEGAGVALAQRPRLQNLPPYQVRRTVVQYRRGWEAAAAQLAQRLPAGAQLSLAPDQDLSGDVRLVLGHDSRAWLADCVGRRACGASLAGVPDRQVASR